MRIDIAPAKSQDGKRSAVVLIFTSDTAEMTTQFVLDIAAAKVVAEKLPLVIAEADSCIVQPGGGPVVPMPFRKQ
jgi:hypothetical protein